MSVAPDKVNVFFGQVPHAFAISLKYLPVEHFSQVEEPG